MGQKYPIVFESWRNKWNNLSNYFKYAEPIGRVIYTANIIESVHHQFRTITAMIGVGGGMILIAIFTLFFTCISSYANSRYKSMGK